MQHSPWIDRCAETLGAEAEFSTDTQLKQYIEIQSLARQSRQLLDEERRGLHHPPAASWGRIIAAVAKHQTQTKEMMSLLTDNCDCELFHPVYLKIPN